MEVAGFYISLSYDTALALIPISGPFAGLDAEREKCALVGGISVALPIKPLMLSISIGGGARWLYPFNGISKDTTDTQSILEAGLKFYLLREFYLLGTYRLTGFKEHDFTCGAGFAIWPVQ